MDIAALRDHANEMLTVIAADLATPQDRFARSEKSKGRSDADDPAATTAAEEHGMGRADSGFTVEQMVAEYRALRASVIRLWTQAEGELVGEHIEDLTRFNEAIDQSLAESVSQFNQTIENAKEMFLAILGHDLRTPLGAISMSAQVLLEVPDLEEAHRSRMTAAIGNSATRTLQMVGDLLDFTRSRLGGGIPVVRAEMSMGNLVHDVVEEISTAHPRCPIQIHNGGEHWGHWDHGRISQALGNLIGNAVKHGPEGSTVTVAVGGDDGQVAIAVHNGGVPIPPDQLDGIFNPMKVRTSPRNERARGPTGSLGLGLYIAEQIVSAHDGRIEVESSEASGTTFTLYLPRRVKLNGKHL